MQVLLCALIIATLFIASNLLCFNYFLQNSRNTCESFHNPSQNIVFHFRRVAVTSLSFCDFALFRALYCVISSQKNFSMINTVQSSFLNVTESVFYLNLSDGKKFIFTATCRQGQYLLAIRKVKPVPAFFISGATEFVDLRYNSCRNRHFFSRLALYHFIYGRHDGANAMLMKITLTKDSVVCEL